MRVSSFATSLVVGLCVFASAAQANHHVSQIEQVIGGVNGDTDFQAIQLRMRIAGQTVMSNAKVSAFDANGLNPVLLHNFTTNVAVGTAGSRILLASAQFGNRTGGLTPDFTMTNLIPASYLNGGKIAFEADGGTIWWSLSYGTYVGSNAGNTTNDTDGNFGPSEPGPLPSGSLQALQFTGAFGDPSTNNAANYAITPGAATFTNNAGTSATVVPEPALAALLPLAALALRRRRAA